MSDSTITRETTTRPRGRPRLGLEEEVLRLRETLSTSEVAEKLQVSSNYVRRMIQRQGMREVAKDRRPMRERKEPSLSAEEKAADDLAVMSEWLARLQAGRGTLADLSRTVAAAYARRAIRILQALLRKELSWHRFAHQARTMEIDQ